MPVRPPVHRPLGDNPSLRPQRRSDAFYHGAAWQRICAGVLARDGYRCQIALFGCRIRANTVDHIIAREDGGSDDDGNLRSCCAPCHNRRHPEKGGALRSQCLGTEF